MSLGQEVFTDLDFADDVSIMAEMLEVLILALEIMNEESSVQGHSIHTIYRHPRLQYPALVCTSKESRKRLKCYL